ncbi:MAG: hypothetical protein IBJ19_00820 [Gemmatimonadaceae bacterium]|nr:hypothetical protein [Gemmatimonadaceae bacterium]
MPRPRKLLSHTTHLPDGRRIVLEERRNRRPQARWWDPEKQGYHRVSLMTVPHLNNGITRQLCPTMIARALEEAAARLPNPNARPRVTVDDALHAALEGDAKKERRKGSEQQQEWSRARAELQAVLTVPIPVEELLPQHLTLVARSALLRVSAGCSLDDWGHSIDAIGSPATAALSSIQWIEQMQQMLRSVYATALESADPDRRRTPGLPWAVRCAEVLRAALRQAGQHPDFARLQHFSLSKDMMVALANEAEDCGIDLPDGPARPRYEEKAARGLFRLLRDPRWRLLSLLSRTKRGRVGALEITRATLQVRKGELVVRQCVGGQKNPNQFLHTPIAPAAAQMVQHVLLTHYADAEAQYQDDGTDYALFDGWTWDGRTLTASASTKFVDVDPRLLLLLEIGAEARWEQQIRLHRRDLLTSGATFLTSEVGLGDNKRSGTRPLSATALEALGFELEYGYLAELEQAFRRGEIKDYPLFAGKEFNGGVIPWRGDALAPIHADVLKRWNKRLEQALGLTSVDGLGFRGWRRRLADVYERWATSARVKDMIMGHKQVKVNFNGGSTREVVYLDIRDEALTTEAMRLLQHARTQWALTGEAPPTST